VLYADDRAGLKRPTQHLKDSQGSAGTRLVLREDRDGPSQQSQDGAGTVIGNRSNDGGRLGCCEGGTWHYGTALPNVGQRSGWSGVESRPARSHTRTLAARPLARRCYLDDGKSHRHVLPIRVHPRHGTMHRPDGHFQRDESDGFFDLHTGVSAGQNVVCRRGSLIRCSITFVRSTRAARCLHNSAHLRALTRGQNPLPNRYIRSGASSLDLAEGHANRDRKGSAGPVRAEPRRSAHSAAHGLSPALGTYLGADPFDHHDDLTAPVHALSRNCSLAATTGDNQPPRAGLRPLPAGRNHPPLDHRPRYRPARRAVSRLGDQ
jgi:hypothetical protein